MKPFASFFGLPIGISFSVWATIGLIRLLYEKLNKPQVKKRKNRYKSSDIAVVIPAHNEEVVIRSCIQALKQSLKSRQIYVASDGSKDKTFRRARMEDVHVSQLNPGRGKAKALIHLIKRFHLYERYKFIFIVDADTKIDKDFVKNALPLFNDPAIGVVFGAVRIKWKQHFIPKFSHYLILYRERLSRSLQYFLAFGQTWKYTNVNYVIPGFATIYKSSILSNLEIDTPGLLIEDFNLAFQVHRKKICKIGFATNSIGWDQHPDNLPDYWKQVRRWNIGFFQTVKKNGIWPSFFWLTLLVFSLEVSLNSLFILILPLVIFLKSLPALSSVHPVFSNLNSLYMNFEVFGYLSFWDILFGSFIFDYIFSIIMAFVVRKPQLIFYGLFFFFMHFVTSLILISSFIPGFFGKSKGRWTSPKRYKS